MQTQEIQQSITDKQNSKFVVTVYHERQWKATYGYVNFTSYYLKYMQENNKYTEDTAHAIELGRIVRIVENRLRGPFKENKIRTIIVYLNQNRGNRNLGDNQEFVKIVLKDNKITQFYCNHTDEGWIQFMTSIVNQIQEKLNQYPS